MKTYEEIVEFSRKALRDLNTPNCDGTYDEPSELMEESRKYHRLVVEACDKQISMKPKALRSAPMRRNGLRWKCKVCSRALCETDYHCPGCGQKIDWSEE